MPVAHLPYTEGPIDPLRSYDLYLPDEPQEHTAVIVFVHGGAWRSGDKSDHVWLANALVEQTGLAVAVPNYRLSPSIRYPTHTTDIQKALLSLISLRSLPDSDPSHADHTFDISEIWCVGHSAGAHILATLCLSPVNTSSIDPPPRLPTPTSLLGAIKGVVGVEGIYDIDLLLQSFPSTYYRKFIQQAFGVKSSYSDADTTSYMCAEGGEEIRWLIIHSNGDQLVDRIQAENMFKRLRVLFQSGPASVKYDFAFQEDHDEVLLSHTLPRLVAGFISLQL